MGIGSALEVMSVDFGACCSTLDCVLTKRASPSRQIIPAQCQGEVSEAEQLCARGLRKAGSGAASYLHETRLTAGI